MPVGSMMQFFRDRGGPNTEHGNYLFWPGTVDGFPVRSNQAPHLRQHELESLPLSLNFRSRMFRLWEPTDKRAFDQVMNCIINTWYREHKRYDTWVPEQQAYLVWLEWIQIYGEIPDAHVPWSGQDVHADTFQLQAGQPTDFHRGIAGLDL